MLLLHQELLELADWHIRSATKEKSDSHGANHSLLLQMASYIVAFHLLITDWIGDMKHNVCLWHVFAGSMLCSTAYDLANFFSSHIYTAAISIPKSVLFMAVWMIRLKSNKREWYTRKDCGLWAQNGWKETSCALAKKGGFKPKKLSRKWNWTKVPQQAHPPKRPCTTKY